MKVNVLFTLLSVGYLIYAIQLNPFNCHSIGCKICSANFFWLFLVIVQTARDAELDNWECLYSCLDLFWSTYLHISNKYRLVYWSFYPRLTQLWGARVWPRRWLVAIDPRTYSYYRTPAAAGHIGTRRHGNQSGKLSLSLDQKYFTSYI